MAPSRSLVAAAMAVLVAIGITSLSFTTYYETPSFENTTIVNASAPSVFEHDERLAAPTLATIETKNEKFSSPIAPPRAMPTTLSASMGFEGKTIPECCCSFCEIEEANAEIVYPLLQKIVETPFFSHFKIDLCSTCELWEDAPLCRMKDCGVCECEEPPEWSANVPELPPTGPDPYAGGDCDGIADDNVVTAVDAQVVDGWDGAPAFVPPGGGMGDLSFLTDESDVEEDLLESSSSAAQVVDLLKNPEGYTGYTGPSAEKVWSAIHSQNCFQKPTPATTEDDFPIDESGEIGESEGNDQYCSLSPEQRLYNRFISGLHSSISLHIAHSYCLEMDPNAVGECMMWGPNDALAYERVLDHPDRVENLYVAFSLLLRAVVKAEFAIAAAVPVEDPVLHESLEYWQESLLPELLALPDRAPATFDESALLNLGDEDSLKRKRAELQRRFQELQSIMQCVGCDRCKLWGTLQTLGVGTALRILFHDPHKSIHLTRQEAVALVNTLERLSSSLVFAREFRIRREETDVFSAADGDPDASCSVGT